MKLRISISSVTSLDLDRKKSWSLLHDKNLHSTDTNTELGFPRHESLHAFAVDRYYIFGIVLHVFCQSSFSTYALTVCLNSLVTA